jgi:hypothetical protein
MKNIFNYFLKLFSRYDEIVSIEKYDLIETIDIETDGDHLFFANDLLTHNSSSGGGYAGENIDISNVSESAGITATADGIIALYQLEGEREESRINVKILKNRLGGYVDRKFPLKVNYETLKMEDFDNDGSINDDVFGNVMPGDDEFKTVKKMDQHSSDSYDDLDEI